MIAGPDSTADTMQRALAQSINALDAVLRHGTRSLIGALICLASSVAPGAPSAHAQPTPEVLDEAKMDARAAADRGRALYEAGRYAEAMEAFVAADQTFHAPTIVLMIARTCEKRGQLLEARAHYQRVIDEQVAHYAPRVFFEAQAQAKKELDALQQRIPILVVMVAGVADATLTIDGQPAAPSEEIELNPGEYTAVASASGRRPVSRTITLQEGDAAEITLVLEQAPPPPTPKPNTSIRRPGMSAPARDRTEATSRGYPTAALGALGVAGAALGVAAVTGAMSLSATGALEQECQRRSCYDDAGGATYDRALAMGTVSTIGLVVGGVAAGTGVALLLWPRGDRGQPQVGLRVTPHGAGVHGRF
ncbi:MAG TPA: hypothetical protein VLS89_10895 [Candidatus Nanopelagicales bacterium]|nr:hypothetical protein [Candidatus Nanopelagicales bacterium]